MSGAGGVLVWFRQDLRLGDNPALLAAVRDGGPVLPVYVWSPEEEGRWPPGAASRWWLHQSLARLDASLRRCGSRLIIRRGPTLDALRGLLAESGATAVCWNRRFEAAAKGRDAAVQTALRRDGVTAESFNGGLLFEPWAVQTRTGQPYQVFAPFWKACLAREEPPPPDPAPARVPPPRSWPASLDLAELGLEPTIDWAGGLRACWRPGEAGAADQLDRFLNEALDEYPAGRDRPDRAGTSRLSPHLHFGEVGARQVWYAVRGLRGGKATGVRARSADSYRRELGWREFAHHLLYHFPLTPERPLREAFADFPWRAAPEHLRAWQRGRTGYPFVDAGLRELWHTGWMHNRVRMVVASFLVKDLLVSWREGAAWFWDTLVDADLANNTLGWQWVAGCGADAAPYFRIFNPVSQGEKFDPGGDYVRRWVPELAGLPVPWVHRPWEAPASALAGAGVELGVTYPRPIVDHGEARSRALEALQSTKK
jgi:deoxyribodipyrimidine photo-lyase